MLLRAAKQGHAGAAEEVGRFHQFWPAIGNGPAEAARWYAMAAAEGRPSAKRRLAALYLAGKGVKASRQRAIDLLEAAATDGDVRAMNELGWLHLREVHGRTDIENATRWFGRAGDAVDPDALYEIGRMRYLAAADPEELAAAMGSWRKAAELGSADAQFALGIAYLEDGRVGKDPVGARAYLVAAATRGHVPAMTRLGRLFEEGTGGPAKPVEAFRWYRAAADAGDAEAMVCLDAAYEHGTIVHDPVVALDWYGKAADMGATGAQRALAKLLLDGPLQTRDRSRAFIWLEVASRLGDKAATGEARELSLQLAEAERQAAQASAQAFVDGLRNR